VAVNRRKCEKCSREISRSNFERHQNSCNGPSKALDKTYDDLGNLKCKFCNRNFDGKNSWSNHVRRCPSNPKSGFMINGEPYIHGSLGKKGKNQYTKALETGNEKPVLSEDSRIKIGNANKNRIISAETRQKMRDSAIKRKLGGVRQSSRIKYNDKILGSSYEHRVVVSLDENNVKWETCSRFKYVDPFGKARTYTPDIYLIDYDVYLDPKNDFLINNTNPKLGFSDREKIELVQRQTGIRVIILDKNHLEWNMIETLL
jgi:hypothetical protein